MHMIDYGTQEDTATPPASQPLCAPAPIDKLAAALAKAQAKMTNPPKTKQGQYRGGKYLYADLADVLDHVRGPLSENGLAIVQLLQPGVLVTRLIHASGQYVECLYPLPAGMPSPQDMGSAITYARRYSLCPLLGISGETDDDASQAATAKEEAKELAEAEKTRLANARLEELKKQGKLRSAHDGHVIRPGEDTDKSPAAAPPPTATNQTPVTTPPPEGRIDPRLAAQLARDGITIEQLKEFAVRRNFIKREMDMSKLEEGFIKSCLDGANWKKVIAEMKGKS